MHVKELMSQPPITCRPNETLAEAALRMRAGLCGTIPIVNEERKVIGIITDRDVCLISATRRQAPAEIPIGEVMTQRVFQCEIDDDLETVLETMADHRIRRLPVVDEDGVIVGLISLDDLARYTLRFPARNGPEHRFLRAFVEVSSLRAR